MKIIVDAEPLIQVAETLKKLPVRGEYEDADRWVGCVMTLEMMANNSQVFEEPTGE